eukprot:3928904-Alexandrium_andersonii.AAC.1
MAACQARVWEVSGGSRCYGAPPCPARPDEGEGLPSLHTPMPSSPLREAVSEDSGVSPRSQ